MSERAVSEVEAADLQDKYDQMMRLADVFDRSGEQMRVDVAAGRPRCCATPPSPSPPSSRRSPTRQAEDDVRAATTGKHGLLTRSIEVDADALVVRATVLTYRWIDELQTAAYQTLGAIAGRAIGYLAPNVALGGAIVSAGLIETDALDRDGVAAYLSELAENNPELMDHVTTGGGGLLDGLQMRSLLTAGVLAGDDGRVGRPRRAARHRRRRLLPRRRLGAARHRRRPARDHRDDAAHHGGRSAGEPAAHHRRPDDRPGELAAQRQRAPGLPGPLHRLPHRPRRRHGPPAAARGRRLRLVHRAGRAGHRGRGRRTTPAPT